MQLNKLSASSSGNVTPVIIWISLPGLLILHLLAIKFLIICISFSSFFVCVVENLRCNEYSSNHSFSHKSSRKWVYLLFSCFKRFHFAMISFFWFLSLLLDLWLACCTLSLKLGPWAPCYLRTLYDALQVTSTESFM